MKFKQKLNSKSTEKKEELDSKCIKAKPAWIWQKVCLEYNHAKKAHLNQPLNSQTDPTSTSYDPITLRSLNSCNKTHRFLRYQIYTNQTLPKFRIAKHSWNNRINTWSRSHENRVRVFHFSATVRVHCYLLNCLILFCLRDIIIWIQSIQPLIEI